ncbi:MAG: hypothetical protein WDN07_03700 [Actinomycetota bacterium]
MSFFIAGCILYFLSRSAIGMGDIKLFSLITPLLGSFAHSITTLIYASVIALIYAILVHKRCIPFGPALILGAMVVIISG